MRKSEKYQQYLNGDDRHEAFILKVVPLAKNGLFKEDDLYLYHLQPGEKHCDQKRCVILK